MQRASRRDLATPLAWSVSLAFAAWTAWLLFAFVPPFTDLPQHALTLAMLRDPPRYAAEHVFQLEPWSTNSLWFTIDHLLAPSLTPRDSLALACWIAVVSMPAALAAWAHALGRGAAMAAMLGWMIAWCRTLYWGFVHYTMSLGVGVSVLAADAGLQRWGPGPYQRRRVLVGGLAVLLFLLHAQTFAFVMAALVIQRVVGPAWDPTRRPLRAHLGELAACVAPSLVLFAYWFVTTLAFPDDAGPKIGTVAEGLGMRFDPPHINWRFLTMNAVATVKSSTWDDQLGDKLLLLGALGIVAAAWQGDLLRRSWVLASVALSALGLSAYLFLPAHLVGQFYVSIRMAWWAFAMLVPLAAAPLWAHRLPVLVMAAGAAFVSMYLNARALVDFAAEAAPAHALTARIEPGAKTTTWPRWVTSRAVYGVYYHHINAWHAAQTGGRSHFSFAEFRPNPVVYRDFSHPNTMMTTEETRGWCAAFDGRMTDVDYILVRIPGNDGFCNAFKVYDDQLTEVARDGDWSLVAVDGALPRRPLAHLACGCPSSGRWGDEPAFSLDGSFGDTADSDAAFDTADSDTDGSDRP